MDEPVVTGIAVLIGVLVAVIGVMRVPDITITSFGILVLIAVVRLVWPTGEFIGAVMLMFVGVILLALAALVQAVVALSEEMRRLRRNLLEAGSRRAVADPVEVEIGVALAQERQTRRDQRAKRSAWTRAPLWQ